MRADRPIAELDVARDLVGSLVDVAAVGMTVDEHACAAAPAEQLVQRHAGHLGLEVPERRVHRSNRCHGHGPAAPVRAAIEELPDVLDLVRVAAQQARHDVLAQVGDDRELASVQGRVADAVRPSSVTILSVTKFLPGQVTMTRASTIFIANRLLEQQAAAAKLARDTSAIVCGTAACGLPRVRPMATRLPPLNALVVFEAAARHLSFTRAADSLHVTQAAVSHQIKALEEWLGVPLFHRVGRGKGLALTEAGRTYLPRINAALESIRSATSAVMDKRRQRVLNVATLDSFGLLWLLPRLRRFLSRNPGIDVRILAADLDDDALAMGEVDIDLRYGEGDWPGLQVVRFMTEVIFPVCSPRIITRDRPLDSPSDLSTTRCCTTS